MNMGKNTGILCYGETMARTAGTWGTVRKKTYQTKKGVTTFYRAAYRNPKTAEAREVSRSFETRREAYAWLGREHELVKAYQRGDAEWLPPKERDRKRLEEEHRKSVSYADMAVRFLTTVTKKDGTALAYASRRKLENDVRHTLDSDWGRMPIGKVTLTDIVKWINGHRFIGVYAAHKAVKAMKRIFSQAVAEGVLTKNPMDGIPTPPRPAESGQSRIPVPTPQEWQALAQAMPEYLRAAVYLAIGCGLRESEICALQRRDIDEKRHTVTVRHAIGRGEGDRGALRLKPPKNRTAYRTVPIGESIWPEIERHLKTRPAEPDSMVFSGRRSAILPPGTLRKNVEKARETAGRPDLHVHTLRAAFDTGIIHQGGATMAETMEMAGHTAATVEAVYQRSDPAVIKRAADQWTRYLSDMPDEKEAIEQKIREKREELRLLEAKLEALS